MKADQCVSEPELAKFVDGQLDAETFDRIAAHVDDCEPCQDTVVSLAEKSNTFVESIRTAGEVVDEPQENALKLGLKRMLATMRSRPTTSPSAGATSGIANGDAESSPSQIGPYLIEQQLGQGGMGHVYRATHTKLKRTVALKILPASRWANSSAVSRFEREMEAIGGLDHPNIVRASDAGEDQGMQYLVMEYIDGLDLSRLINRLGPLPVAEACEIARQCAAGLHHAHENGLVHRDIKPSNLMVSTAKGNDESVTLKILDLGLALLGDEHLQEGHELTTVGTLMGTLDYMSPEQGIDSHSVDQRTDIYSLGATIFKLLTGRAPYADPQYSTLMKKMTALATKRAPSIGSVRADLPNGLVQVVDRMLARDPDDRFESAEQVAEALAPFCHDADVKGLLREADSVDDPEEPNIPRIAVTAMQQDAKTAIRDTRRPDPSSSNRRGRGWLIGLAFAFAAGLAGVLFHMSTNYGELTIRSDDPNATVTIASTNQPSREVQIENGERKLKLRVGEYELQVNGNASVSIAPSKVRIDRGSKSAAEVIRLIPSKERIAVQTRTPRNDFERDSERFFTDVRRLVDAGKLHQALQKYDEVLNSEWYADVGYAKAMLLTRLGWHQEAHKVFTQLSRYSNDLREEWYRQRHLEYAKNCMQVGNYQHAIKTLQQGLDELGLTNAALWHQLGIAHRDRYAGPRSDYVPGQAIAESRKEALNCFERTLELEPENENARAALEALRSKIADESAFAANMAKRTDELANRVQQKLAEGQYKLEQTLLDELETVREWRRSQSKGISPDSIITIHVLGTPPERPIAGQFVVDVKGVVNLGPGYGWVKVAGLTSPEASLVITNSLMRELQNPIASVTDGYIPEGRENAGGYMAAPSQLTETEQPALVDDFPAEATLFGPAEQPPSEEQTQLAAHLTSEAEALAEADDLTAALRKYNEAIATVDGDFRANYGRAKVLKALGWTEEALAQMQASLSLGIPADEKKLFLIDLATVSLECGRAHEAVNIMQHAVEESGMADADLWYHLGIAKRAFAEAQQFAPPQEIEALQKQAESSFARAIQLDPTHDAARKATENLQGLKLERQQQDEQLKRDRERLIQLVRKANQNQNYEMDDELAALLRNVRQHRKQRGSSVPLVTVADRLEIEVPDSLPDSPIDGLYRVDANGGIMLGAPYGWIEVADHTADEITFLLGNHLSKYLKVPTPIVSLVPYSDDDEQPLQQESNAQPQETTVLSAKGREILVQFLELKRSNLKAAEARFAAGMEGGESSGLLSARAEVVEAEIRLAEAEGRREVTSDLLNRLVSLREEGVKLVTKAYNEGSITNLAKSAAEEALLNAQLRQSRHAEGDPGDGFGITPVSAGPSFKGFKYAYWLNALRTNRDPQMQADAIEALGLLGADKSLEAARAIFQAAREAAGARVHPKQYARALAGLNHEPVLEAVREELVSGNARSSQILNGIALYIYRNSGNLDADMSILQSAIKQASTELARLRFAYPPSDEEQREAKVAFLSLMLDGYEADPNALRDLVSPNLQKMKMPPQKMERLLRSVPDLPGLAELATNPEQSLQTVARNSSLLGSEHVRPVTHNLIAALEPYADAASNHPFMTDITTLVRLIGEQGQPALDAIPILFEMRNQVPEVAVSLAKLYEFKPSVEVEEWLEQVLVAHRAALRQANDIESRMQREKTSQFHQRIIDAIERALSPGENK